MVGCQHPTLSLCRQCKLVEPNWATFYYRAKGEMPVNLHLIGLMDENRSRVRFPGYRKMTMPEGVSCVINLRRIRRLLSVGFAGGPFMLAHFVSYQRHKKHQHLPHGIVELSQVLRKMRCPRQSVTDRTPVDVFSAKTVAG